MVRADEGTKCCQAVAWKFSVAMECIWNAVNHGLLEEHGRETKFRQNNVGADLFK